MMIKSNNCKWIIKLLCIVLALIILCSTGHWLYADYASQGDNASYIDKMHRLKNLQEKKAVFVGGSATHFGIQAEMFQEKTGIESVNMGLNAGISFGLYMDSIIPYLNEGDIVFVTPEYSYYANEWYNYSEVDAEFLLYYSPEAIGAMGFEDILRMIEPTFFGGCKNFGGFFQDNIRDVLKSGETLYLRSNSNAFGDMIGSKHWPPSAYDSICCDAPLGGFVDSMIACIEKMQARGIEVYVCYPPFNQTSFQQSKTYIDAIHGMLKDRVNVLYFPEMACLPDTVFLDTAYHLRYSEAVEFTNMVILEYYRMSGTK